MEKHKYTLNERGKKFDVEAKLYKKINFNVNKSVKQKEAELKLNVFIAFICV